MTKTVSVLLPIPAERPYTYGVPEGMQLNAGDYVQVPLGPRKVAAIVWDAYVKDEVAPKKLREVIKKFDCPPLPKEMSSFVDWVANYTLSPAGMVAKMVLRSPGALDPLPMSEAFVFSGTRPEKLTPAR
ncbi:MAG: primosomal protein N', partial [Nitratireductor sp.]